MKRLAALAFALAACAKHLPSPTASLSAPSAAHVRVRVQLDGSQSTPAPVNPPAPIVYHWELTQKPAGSGAALTNTDGPGPRFVPDVPGTYAVRLFVTDFAHASAPVEATIEARADCVPTSSVSAALASTNVGQPLSLLGGGQAPCSDVPDTLVKAQWSVAAAPADSQAQILGAQRFDASFVPDVRGDYDLVFKVTDALGFESPAAHTLLTARSCGDNAPRLDALAALPASANVAQPVRLSAQVSDADTQPPCSLPRSLSYAWTLVSLPAGAHAALTDGHAQAPSFTPDAPGDYVAALTVTDENARQSPRGTVTVHVSACGGGVPVAAASGPGSIATGDPAQLHVAVTNPDDVCGLGLSYSYAWQAVAAPQGATAQLNDAGLENPTFTADAPGAYAFSVVATASTGRVSDPALVQVQVDPCGSVRPVAVIVAPSGAATGKPLQLQAQPTDANSCKTVTPYTYRWLLTGLPAGSQARLAGAAADGSSLQSAPSFVPDLDGQYTAQLTVTDALGLVSAPVTASFTVARCNAPPTATITAPAGAASGVPVQVSATVSDPNDPALCGAVAPMAWAWSLAGAPTASQARLNNAAASAPSFTPDLPGTYTLRLQVTDAGGNAAAPVTADVSVAGCGAPLTATIAAGSGATGLPLALGANALDPNDPATNSACSRAVAPFSFAWTLLSAPQGSAAQLNKASSATPSFVPDVAGDYVVALVVTDAAGNRSAQATQTFNAAACTAALTASIVAPAGAQTGAATALSASVTDPNTCVAVQPYRYAWSLTGRPAGSAAALQGAQGGTPRFTPDVSGTYSFTLQVTDAAGNQSNLASASVVAANCTAPLTVSLSASGAATFSSITVSAAVTDPNSGCGTLTPNRFTWSLLAAPSGSAAGLDQTVTPSGATTFTPDKPGSYVIGVRAVDALGNAGTATTTLAVSGCGGGTGVFSAVISTSPVIPEIGERVTASVAITDTFGGASACGVPTVAPFSYAWTLKNPGAGRATLNDGSAAQPTFVPDTAGGHEVNVTVTDALGNQAAAPGKSVTVRDCTLTPAIGAPGAAQLTYGAVQLTSTITRANAACTNPYTLLWSFDTKPSGSTALFNNAAAPNPSFTLDQPNGSWLVRLTVTDPKNGSSTSTTATVQSNSCGSARPAAAAGISLPFPIFVNVAQPDPNVGSTAQYLPGYVLQLDGTGSSNPNAACTSPALSYSWTTYKIPSTSAAKVYPATAAKPTFTPDVQGDYIFQLVVSDGRFPSVPSYLRVNVSDPLGDSVAPATRGVLWNDLEVPNPALPAVNPAIAYYMKNGTGTAYDLLYSKCTANCASGSPTWTTVPIENGALSTGNTQIATAQVALKYLANGNAAVAYRSDPLCQMKYAVLSGGTWNVSPIDSIGATGGGSTGCSGGGSIHGEIQLMFTGASGGTMAVAYHSHNGGMQVMYATCGGAGCTTDGLGTLTWSKKSNIDTSGNNAGHYVTAFTDGSGNPHMAYHRETTADLWYTECTAGCTGGNGSTWATPVLVEGATGSVTSAGLWNSIAVAGNGRIGIGYEDVGTGTVRLATCTSACTTATNWSAQTVATPSGGTGFFPSLQYDSGNLAHITYIDPSSTTLRYAIQTGASSFNFFDIDHGVDDGHSSFILTPSGSTHVSYSLTTGLKYYPFGD